MFCSIAFIVKNWLDVTVSNTTLDDNFRTFSEKKVDKTERLDQAKIDLRTIIKMVAASVSLRDIKRYLSKISAGLHLVVNLKQTTSDGRLSTLATSTRV